MPDRRSDERLARAVAAGDEAAFAAIDGRYRRALFRIAHNEAISVLRRRRPRLGLAELTLGVRSLSDDVELRERLGDVLADPQRLPVRQDVELRERLGDVLADLQRLPVRQRAALVLRELGGRGYPDAGSSAPRWPPPWPGSRPRPREPVDRPRRPRAAHPRQGPHVAVRSSGPACGATRRRPRRHPAARASSVLRGSGSPATGLRGAIALAVAA